MSQTAPSSCGCSTSSKSDTVTYYIDNMDCKNEEAMIRKSLGALDGVSALAFDLKQRTLAITHTLPSLGAVEDALRSIGMRPQRQTVGLAKTRYSIENMDCTSEEALIRSHLGKLDGIEALEFDLKKRTLVVTHNEQARSEMESVFTSIGMKAKVQPDGFQSADERVVFQIDNMDCRSEEAMIRERLGQLDGVKTLEFDLPERKLAITLNAAALAPVEAALASIGMRAQRAGSVQAQAVPALTVAPERAPAQAAKAGDGVTVSYRIENMDCPTEEALIRDRLGKVSGVAKLEFNLMQRVLTVDHTLPSAEPIEQALAAIGMKAQRQGAAGGTTTVLQIAKMDCPTEEGLIRGKLEGMTGIAGLQFNLMQRTLTVQHSPEAITQAVKAIESLGYETVVQTTDEPRDAHSPAPKTNWLPMIFSGVAAVLAEVVYWANGGNHWVVVALALVSIATGGLSTYKKGWIALKNLNLNMNALMAIAVTGAMAIGHWPEAAMVMFLFALAEVIEAKSLDRARNAIRGLMELTPATGHRHRPPGRRRLAGRAGQGGCPAGCGAGQARGTHCLGRHHHLGQFRDQPGPHHRGEPAGRESRGRPGLCRHDQ